MTTLTPLTLRYWPDPNLRVECNECNWDQDERRRTGNEMLEIMYAHHGYGLSAPQVGITSNFFVMRDPQKKDGRPGLIFANPEIVELGNKRVKDFEGCLSLLSMRVPIERATEVEFEFDDPDNEGERLHWRFEGLNARCVQHEMDHLKGVLIFDHINSNLGQKSFLEKYAKKKIQAGRQGIL